ncbi:MAG: DUF4430 domain-containing protein [bacterium]|nr:DUF4430 domain-containing protein [bacterium]
MKQKRYKRIVIYLVLVAIVAFAVSKIKFQTVDEYYSADSSNEGKTIEVSIGIYCDTLLDNYDKLDQSLQSETYVPKDGVILKETIYQMKEGDSAFDLLKKATKENKIQLEYQGADGNAYGSVYIQGINNLYEFSAGSLSGWMYTINDKIPDYGTSKYELKDGDKVAFRYTCDLGKDIGRE